MHSRLSPQPQQIKALQVSNDVISLQVSEDTRKVYDLLVSNTGATDHDIEVHIRRALANLLAEKIEEMHTLRTRLLEDE